MQEEWKPLQEWEFSQYEVSSYGQIRNLSTSYILRGSIHSDGYRKFCLTSDTGQRKFLYCHRLVALAFLSNPDNKDTVDHIDRNKQNNRVDNLRWLSHKEQNLNRNNSVGKNRGRSILQYDKSGDLITSWESAAEAERGLGIDTRRIIDSCRGHTHKDTGFIWKYKEEIDSSEGNEIWKNITLDGWENYSVSSTGKVKRNDGRILKGTIRHGYHEVSIRKGESKLSQRVHRLVANEFLEKVTDDLVVNHKNGNKLDNNVDNLEWVTIADNNRHAVETGLRTKTGKERCIIQLSSIGEEIARHPSIIEAQRQTGVCRQSIGKVCRGERKQAGGFIWQYADI